MEGFTVAAWNIEWSDKLLTALDAGRAEAAQRTAAIAAEIVDLDADILVVTEGPKGEDRARRFFSAAAPGYRLVTHPGSDDGLYGTRGQQWIWFLLREGAGIEGSLLHLDRWTARTAAASWGVYGESWRVAMPRFVESEGRLLLEPEKTHSHHRHPQVLLAQIGAFRFEVIGAHLKSRHIRIATPPGAGTPGFFRDHPAFTAAVIEARAKLTTEATSIRHYIDARFKEEAEFPVIVAGDLNDGPGKELAEEQLLLHDLLSNLQGEVFFARRFLNHALFDFAERQRWTVQFTDRLDPRRRREILLDHILFSQSLTGRQRPGVAPYRAVSGGGFVAHEAHHRANAGLPRGVTTSDHRAVVMRFEARQGLG